MKGKPHESQPAIQTDRTTAKICASSAISVRMMLEEIPHTEVSLKVKSHSSLVKVGECVRCWLEKQVSNMTRQPY